MASKFELYKSSNGEYRWRLKSGNGLIVAAFRAPAGIAGAAGISGHHAH